MLTRYMLSSCVLPSVRSSVCHSRNSNKMAEPRITQTTVYDRGVVRVKCLAFDDRLLPKWTRSESRDPFLI